MMYGSWDMECNRQNFLSLWTVFCSFIPPYGLMYGSWDMECNRHNFLSLWTIFFLFYPNMDPENESFEKMKKRPGDIILHVYCKWQLYDVWFLRYEAWQTEFFAILDHFLPFYPPNNSKNENFEKLKKNTWRCYHFSLCTINGNHMMYGFWDIACDGCNCSFSFCTSFCPFTPLTCLKNENLKKMKKTPGDIIILHQCTKNHNHKLYCSWDMVHDRCNCHFSFWTIFALLPPTPTASKMKISK